MPNPFTTRFSSNKWRTQSETMASRTHRNWPVTARYVSRAAKARFPTSRPVPLSMRLPPPLKKGPLPAPATLRRRRRRSATVLEARATLFPKNSVRPNGLAMEHVPFEIFGGCLRVLGSRRACGLQKSRGRRAGGWSEAIRGEKGLQEYP
jgi:hypothetical protein